MYELVFTADPDDRGPLQTSIADAVEQAITDSQADEAYEVWQIADDDNRTRMVRLTRGRTGGDPVFRADHLDPILHADYRTLRDAEQAGGWDGYAKAVDVRRNLAADTQAPAWLRAYADTIVDTLRCSAPRTPDPGGSGPLRVFISPIDDDGRSSVAA